MIEDKRFYTFVFAPTAKSQLRKLNVHHNVIYLLLGFAAVGVLTVAYGTWRLAQHAVVVAKLNMTVQENRRLRERNQEAEGKYDLIKTRLAALDTTQRKLAETSGISRHLDISRNIGQGGPDSDTDLTDIERATAALEAELRTIKDVFDKDQVRLSSTPAGWPVRGYITDGFGNRRNPFGGSGSEMHAGLDIATNHGTAIESTADGIVIFAGPYAGYGNVVVIDHGYGVTTRYAHMSSIAVSVGNHVTRGKQIGAVGSTGRSTAPHCHYEVRLHDRPVNPLNYISVGRS
ncbi:MAG: peptidoglycan DD-metalloendopeptidase family protein [Acidobacteria bacterium]|nr:peptidoglycan DD-metalloendopeptidase family protein [Acidobacteriota bacterium]